MLENSHIKNREDVHIDPEDRGYQFGDGVYEVIRVYNGKPFLLDDHLARLERSVREMRMTLPLSIELLRERIDELIVREQCKTGSVYLQVTRGVAPRIHHFPASGKSFLTGYVTRRERPLEQLEKGIKALTTEDIRWLRCDIKSLNLLGSVFAKQKAIENGCQEAILHRNETVTECSSANFFIVKGGVVYTHPTNHLILSGVTRAAVLRLAQKLNIDVEETPFQRKDIYTADEAFLTGTITEVSPVVNVDDQPIADGRPGEVTRKLQQAFFELIP